VFLRRHHSVHLMQKTLHIGSDWCVCHVSHLAPGTWLHLCPYIFVGPQKQWLLLPVSKQGLTIIDSCGALPLPAIMQGLRTGLSLGGTPEACRCQEHRALQHSCIRFRTGGCFRAPGI
jgi:hypothetical protein